MKKSKYGTKKETLHIRINEDLKKEAQELAESEGKSLAQLVSDLLEEAVEKNTLLLS